MKILLSFLVYSLAAFEIRAEEPVLTVTVFYEINCCADTNIFGDQILPTLSDPTISELVHVELVPFGKAQFTNNPFYINCEHGDNECYGNTMHSCFIAKNPDNIMQVSFINCTILDSDPLFSGDRCCQLLGCDYLGIPECINSAEGFTLQIKNGKRTLSFQPPITNIPTFAYNNVYNEMDQTDSLTDFRGVVIRKLQEQGIAVE